MAKGQTFSEWDKKERWEIIASFPNYDDSIQCVCQLPEHSNAMATASDSWERLFFKGREREESPPPILSQADVV